MVLLWCGHGALWGEWGLTLEVKHAERTVKLVHILLSTHGSILDARSLMQLFDRCYVQVEARRVAIQVPGQ